MPAYTWVAALNANVGDAGLAPTAKLDDGDVCDTSTYEGQYSDWQHRSEQDSNLTIICDLGFSLLVGRVQATVSIFTDVTYSIAWSGSNDGSNWTTLVSGLIAPSGISTWTSFDTDAMGGMEPIAFRFWRLCVYAECSEASLFHATWSQALASDFRITLAADLPATGAHKMARASILERVLLAPETTEGTAVQTTRRLLGLGLDMDPVTPTEPVKVVGNKAPVGVVALKESTDGTVKGIWAFDEFLFMVLSMLVNVTPTVPTTNGTFTVTLGAQTTGHFHLIFNGQTTGVIAYGATAADVLAALVAISTILVGNVTVTGAAGGPFTVTLAGNLAKSGLMMTADFSALTTPANASIATTAGTLTRRWTLNPSGDDPDLTKAYTFAKGSSADAGRAPGGKFTDLSLTCIEKGCDVSGKILARQFQEGYRVQNVWLMGSAGGGTWGLNVNGQVASGLAPGITTAALQTALEALSNVDAGDIAVIGPDGGPWTIEFLLTGQWGSVHCPLLAVTNSLTGGSSPAPHVGYCLDGLSVTEIAHVPVDPTSVSVYVGDTLLTMVKLSKCQSAKLDVKARHKGVFCLTDSDPSYSFTIEQAADPTLQLIVEQDSAADQWMDTLRSTSTVYARIVATGPAIETGFTYRAQITLPCKFSGAKRGDHEGLYAGTYDLSAIVDKAGLGTYCQVVLDTALASL